MIRVTVLGKSKMHVNKNHVSEMTLSTEIKTTGYISKEGI